MVIRSEFDTITKKYVMHKL